MHHYFCYQGNTQLKGLQFYVLGSVSALALESEFYLNSARPISIFHHVKQIEDNESRRDEGGKHVHGIQRDRSVSSGIQRPAVGEPIIGYALEIDGLPLLLVHSAFAEAI